MAPSLPGGVGSPTSKSSRLVILQGFPGLQETNKQSTRFSEGRVMATDTKTDDGDDDDDDDDDGGQCLLTTRARSDAKSFTCSNSFVLCNNAKRPTMRLPHFTAKDR